MAKKNVCTFKQFIALFTISSGECRSKAQLANKVKPWNPKEDLQSLRKRGLIEWNSAMGWRATEKGMLLLTQWACCMKTGNYTVTECQNGIVVDTGQ